MFVILKLRAIYSQPIDFKHLLRWSFANFTHFTNLAGPNQLPLELLPELSSRRG